MPSYSSRTSSRQAKWTEGVSLVSSDCWVDCMLGIMHRVCRKQTCLPQAELLAANGYKEMIYSCSSKVVWDSYMIICGPVLSLALQRRCC